jgi:hypothetical protein
MKKLLFSLSMVLFAVLLSPLLSNSSGTTAAAAMPGPYSYRFYCASDDFYRRFCSIETSGRVQIVRQRSESPCIYGRTWGTTGGGVWVDRGCRADFVVNASEWYDNGDYGNYRDYDNYHRSRVVYCASDGFDFRTCSTDTYSGVRLLRQRSDSPCIYGRTWGYDQRGIWVDRGCRADFEVGRQRYDRYWNR